MGCGSSRKNPKIHKPNLSGSSLANNKPTNRLSLTIQQGYPSEEYKELSWLSNTTTQVTKTLQISLNATRVTKRITKPNYSNLDPKILEETKEMRVWRSLDHPNLPKIYNLYETPEYWYVVMEHCNGKELLEKFREMRDLTEEKIGCIMKQLLLTVAYIHSRRIVHRNINLEHILLDHSDEMLQIKLLGFSNAAFHAGTKLSGKFGTSYYMAPEVFNGNYNEKCDEWSCGMIMYILLTGITPYPNKSVQEISDEMKMSPFQPQIGDLRGISPKAVMLLQQLLQVDPISRISAYTALTHPWIQQIQSYNTDNSEVLGRLQNLQRNSGFTQVAGTLVSQTLSSEDEKQIIKAFNTFDINNDGYISKQELMEAFALKRHNKNVKFDVNRIIEATHGMSDHISYSEFLQLCISQASYTSKENLAEIFGKLDSNKHGKINQNDIKNLLNYNNKVSDDVWAQMLKEADTNKDGFVDFDEFVSSMNRNV